MAASHPRRAAEAGGLADNVALEAWQFNRFGAGSFDGSPARPIFMPRSTPNSSGARVTVDLARRAVGGSAKAIALSGPALTLQPLHVSARVRLAHAIPRAAGG
jgi:hypothetical protein